MIALLGIDCAVDSRKTGTALGELRDGVVHILRCAKGSKSKSPAMIAADWLHLYEDAIIALDAPLGWPRPFGQCLSSHKAGDPFRFESNRLFRRVTDMEIKKRIGKQPLDVGSNLIARTAIAALKLLDQLRQITGRKIPLAWAREEKERWRAIEVYPAATRISHGAPDIGGSLEGLDKLVNISGVESEALKSKDVVDAVVCVLGAANFIRENVVPPLDKETALIEGWIWAPPKSQAATNKYL
jgi:predicted RNase H-like nuclease